MKKTKKEFLNALNETGLYVITDKEMASKSHHELAKECFAAGARIIQIRDKNLHDQDFYQQAYKSINMSHDNSFLIINDRVDIAYLTEADGVHLGQEDLPVEAARKLLGKKIIIGISTHNEEQFLLALNKEVDYIAVGPVFATQTKVSTNPPLGLDYLAHVRKLTAKPLVAIGGINLEHALKIWNIGINAVAVVSDIMKASSPAKRIMQYLELRREGMKG